MMDAGASHDLRVDAECWVLDPFKRCIGLGARGTEFFTGGGRVVGDDGLEPNRIGEAGNRFEAGGLILLKRGNATVVERIAHAVADQHGDEQHRQDQRNDQLQTQRQRSE